MVSGSLLSSVHQSKHNLLLESLNNVRFVALETKIDKFFHSCTLYLEEISANSNSKLSLSIDRNRDFGSIKSL